MSFSAGNVASGDASQDDVRAEEPGDAARVNVRSGKGGILFILCVFSALDSIDQGALGLVIDRIRRDFVLTHFEVSFLLGFAGMAMSTLLLLPVGLMVDRFSRKWLLLGTSLVWAGTATINGMATGFWQLLVARSGSAAADAVLKPSSQSILRDIFPPERRGLPFSLYWGCFSLGGGISFYLSGSLIGLVDGGFFRNVPLLGHFRAWQLVLALPGLCTLPFAALLFRLREPPRESGPAHRATTGDTLQFLKSYWWLYWPSFAYSILWSVPNAGYLWTPTVLTESWRIPEAEIGHMIGLMGMSMSVLGTLGGGLLVDLLSRRGRPDAALRLTIVTSALMAFDQTGILHVGPRWAVFSLIGVMYVLQGTINASYYVAIAAVTPGRFMGRMFAMQFICLSLPGALAPTLIAGLAGMFHTPDAMAISVNLCVGFGSAIYLSLLLLFSFRVGRLRAVEAG